MITSLPDISELGSRRRRLTPEHYEAWFVAAVRALLRRLPPEQVAIFYQTPGRTSGAGGAWLDKVASERRRGMSGSPLVVEKLPLYSDASLVKGARSYDRRDYLSETDGAEQTTRQLDYTAARRRRSLLYTDDVC